MNGKEWQENLAVTLKSLGDARASIAANAAGHRTGCDCVLCEAWRLIRKAADLIEAEMSREKKEV